MSLVSFVKNITLETSGILMMQALYNKAGAGVIKVVETICVRTLLETQKAPFYINDTIPNKPVIN
jgi:hypothetical protein